jgi:hypothetical protein
MLISRANKARYGWLKEQLENNYLLGTNQYRNTLEKASRILGNYQGAKTLQSRERRSKGGGLRFIQKRGRGRRGGGVGRGAGNIGHCEGAQSVSAEDAAGGGSNTANTMALPGGAVRTNKVTATTVEKRDSRQGSTYTSQQSSYTWWWKDKTKKIKKGVSSPILPCQHVAGRWAA